MKIEYDFGSSGENLAAFSLYFIRHRKAFSRNFTLEKALLHLLETLSVSELLLLRDEQRAIVGYASFRCQQLDGQPDPQGKVAFVDSVVLEEDHRSSRVFVRSFREMVRYMLENYRGVQLFQFHALADQPYLNRLYGKFAEITGQAEGIHGPENIYTVDIDKLYSYLTSFK